MGNPSYLPYISLPTEILLPPNNSLKKFFHSVITNGACLIRFMMIINHCYGGNNKFSSYLLTSLHFWQNFSEILKLLFNSIWVSEPLTYFLNCIPLYMLYFSVFYQNTEFNFSYTYILIPIIIPIFFTYKIVVSEKSFGKCS